ncbi:MAG: hypothetical protein HYS78_02250 [Parcubacteria group bacterium]|nr:hypothetical protein [Parcubacteria group bacterium]
MLNITQRGLWWSQLKSIKKIEWLLKGPEKSLAIRKNESVEESFSVKLDELKNLFSKSGYEIYLADATSLLAEKYGLYIVMSLIPGFYPLYLDERYKYLGIERLYNLPIKLGYLKEARREEEINIVPHPMM